MAVFLLTPLREGRHVGFQGVVTAAAISTHAPAGGATDEYKKAFMNYALFLLTPLREGRR